MQEKLLLKTQNFPSKLEIFTELKSIVSTLAFLVTKTKHNIQLCVENNFKILVYLLLIEEEGKRYYVLIKDFNPFTYNHTLYRRTNHFIVIVYKLLVQEKY